jgi:hypothetical protein
MAEHLAGKHKAQSSTPRKGVERKEGKKEGRKGGGKGGRGGGREGGMVAI